MRQKTLHMSVNGRMLVLALACFAAQPAAALDCGGLRASAIPFEIRLERKIQLADNAPAVAAGQLQVFRKGDSVVTYQSFSPDGFFRTRYAFSGFPVEFFVSKEGTRVDLTYSIAPSAALFADEKPVSFHVSMKRQDGQTVGEQDHEVSFLGHHTIDLAGCEFEVVKSLRKVTGVINEKYSESLTEFWYSPELRTALHTRTVVANGPSQTYTASDISVDVKPME